MMEIGCVDGIKALLTVGFSPRLAFASRLAPLILIAPFRTTKSKIPISVTVTPFFRETVISVSVSDET
jgi:hypothetical protein